MNQYTAITHPGAFDVLGRAPATVTVSVNSEPVTRQGAFWRRELGDLPNSLAAVWQSVQVDALDPGAGPEGADLPARRSGHRYVPKAFEVPAYDLDGNLLAEARWNYLWDAENRLVEVSTGPAALAAGVPQERTQYVYDSRSRRIGRTVASWSTATSAWMVQKSERFVYDDWNVVAVVDAAGSVVQRYAWGNDLSGTPQGAGGVGGLLAAADAASGRSWTYAYDGNGNVSAVVDLADGTKVGRYEYDAFGRTIATWGDEALAEVNPYRFSTKPLEGTGLYYYGFRWYEAENGRWLGRDPIWERGGVNLYGFVGNDPLTKIDRLGQITIASKIDLIVAGRLSFATSPIGQVANRYLKNDYSINDDEYKMVDLVDKVRKTYETYLAENPPRSCSWVHKTFSINATRKHGVFRAKNYGMFSTGWWLTDCADVSVRADVHVRCEGANLLMKINSASWTWNDILDANAYPDADLLTMTSHWAENVTHNTIQPLTGFLFNLRVTFDEKLGKIVSRPK